jgi:hypothetical protein
LRYVTIGNYQVSTLLLLLALAVFPIISGAAYYLWTTRKVDFLVDEPLTITHYPTSFHVHPGENLTLVTEIENVAPVNYSVTLIFTLNDTVYQASYVTFSNRTYTVTQGTNLIEAWMTIDKSAHPAVLELAMDFYRE